MRYLLSSYYSLYCYHIACFFSILLSLFHHVVFFDSKSHTHNSYTYTLSRENSTHSLTHPHSNFPPITVKHSLSYLLGRFLCFFWIFFFPIICLHFVKRNLFSRLDATVFTFFLAHVAQFTFFFSCIFMFYFFSWIISIYYRFFFCYIFP